MARAIAAAIILAAGFSSNVLAQPDSVYVTIVGDTVRAWDINIEENCAARFAVSVARSDSNVFSVTERDTIKAKANCDCTYFVDVCLPGIASAGSYSVRFYRQYLKQYGYDIDTTVFVGSAKFSIAGQPEIQTPAIWYQSKCHEAPAGVSREPPLPLEPVLYQCYPNPFNPATTIRYALPHRGRVALSVFNLLGQVVSTIVNGEEEAGYHEVRFDASNLASGVYFCRLQGGSSVQTRTLLLIR